MSDAYSTRLRFDKQEVSAKTNTWGTDLNTTLELIDDAIAGMTTIATTGGTTTLSANNNTADQARCAIIKVTGVLTSNAILQIPSQTKTYVVWNATTGAYTLTIKTSGGTAATITQAKKAIVVCDATDCYGAFDDGTLLGGWAAGKQTIWLPASAFTPRATNGCAVLATVAAGSGQADIRTLDFDASAVEYAQSMVAMPKSWDNGTLTAQFVWKHAATTTNFDVIWGLQGLAVSNDDSFAQAFGTAQEVTDTGGTTNDHYVSAATSAITLAGTPAQSDSVVVQVYRLATDGADTMAIDAGLVGVKLYYTVNASNDT